MKPIIIAHRGASALAKVENSLEAFQIAIDLNCDYAEFDIRKTKDNKLIVFHNDNINNIPLKNLTYSELCEITKQDDYAPPLLTEVLALCQHKIKLDIELKEYGYEDKVIHLVKKYFDYSDYSIKSFIDKTVARIKQIDSNIRTGLLIGSDNNALYNRFNEYFPERRLRMCKADFISPHYKILTKEYIHRLQKKGYPIYTWTVNEPKIIFKLLSRNVDGIITDRPDIALHLRDGLILEKEN